jgi:plastocyanin
MERRPLGHVTTLATIAMAGVASLAWAGILAGGGSAESDCYVELHVRGLEDAQVNGNRVVSCTDGDACDNDRRCGNDACVFSIAVCVSRPDPSLPVCTPAPLRRLVGRARSVGADRRQISDRDLRSLLLTSFPVAYKSGTSCGTPSGMRVSVRAGRSGRKASGMLAVSLDATAARGVVPSRDRDRIVLRCLPRTDECPGSTSTTTTTLPGLSSSPLVLVGADGIHFDPETVRIRAGDTVRWLWAGSGYSVVHRPATGDAAFCSPNDERCDWAPFSLSGSTYEHTFPDAGTFPYESDAGFPLQGLVIVDP